MSMNVTVELPQGPVALSAVQLPRNGHVIDDLVAGDPAVAWAAFEGGEILISDPLAYRNQLHIGDSLTVPTDTGPHSFRIAGVYREYGNDRGTVRMSLPVYRRFWHDEGITAMGFYLAPGASLTHIMAELRAAAQGRHLL